MSEEEVHSIITDEVYILDKIYNLLDPSSDERISRISARFDGPENSWIYIVMRDGQKKVLTFVEPSKKMAEENKLKKKEQGE